MAKQLQTQYKDMEVKLSRWYELLKISGGNTKSIVREEILMELNRQG